MSDSHECDVVVVGAGLAGLRAAQVLNDAGRHVVLLDADDHVGGRLSSRTVDGYVLDEGFQLINPAYPELVASGVMTHFDLRRFEAAVRYSDGVVTREIGDPARIRVGSRRRCVIPSSRAATRRDSRASSSRSARAPWRDCCVTPTPRPGRDSPRVA